MNDIYGIIEEYNPNKELKLLMVFDDKTADMLSNKDLNLVATELFIRQRKFLLFLLRNLILLYQKILD